MIKRVAGLVGKGLLEQQWGIGFAKTKEVNKQKQKVPDNAPKVKHKGPKVSEVVDWSKYGLEVGQILGSSRTVTDLDVAFIANQVVNRQISLDMTLSQQLKKTIKNLPSIDFSLLGQIVRLAESTGSFNPFANCMKCYLQYYRINLFNREEIAALDLSEAFLRKVAAQHFKVVASRDEEQMVQVLHFYASMMSANELKEVDEMLAERAFIMKIENVVRVLNVFRQVKRRGMLCQVAAEVMGEKQEELDFKFWVMGAMSLLELGEVNGFKRMEEGMDARMKSEMLGEPEWAAVLHLFHRFKVGGKLTWMTLLAHFQKKKQIPFEHLFALMSGLTRNYSPKGSLLPSLIEKQPKMTYMSTLSQSQFVQFCFVIYCHYLQLEDPPKQELKTILSKQLQRLKFRNIYEEIRHLFLYLWSTEDHRNLLSKTYPDSILISLLSLAFKEPFINGDPSQAKAYEQQILTIHPLNRWKSMPEVIVVQQFIRYKMMSLKGAKQNYAE